MKSMLGRVGGVVGGVAKAAWAAGADQSKAAFTAPPDDDEAEVEQLLQRVSDALMPEYRREGMSQLKDLLVDNPKAQLALGNMGIPTLVTVLMDDRDDLELVRGALECLAHAMAGGAPGHTSAAAPGVNAAEAQAGAVNAELFARKPEHVSLLLALLEDEPVGINDFYVRYHTVQLLTALLQVCAYRLQAAILQSPMGVVRLMDMLTEREVIRNEALLLLVALTRANGEVQKIAAFEGAFDRVFNIVREEGGADGGVVVQDCLELLNNLLRQNQANQRLFREMGYIQQLPRIFSAAVPPPSATGSTERGALQDPAALGAAAFGAAMGAVGVAAAAGAAAAAAAGVQLGDTIGGALSAAAAGVKPVSISKQKASILLCALETVQLLVTASPSPTSLPGQDAEAARAAEAASRVASQAMLVAGGLVDALLPLCLVLGGVSSAVVRAQALQTLGDLVLRSPQGQERLGSASVLVAPGLELPALHAVLRAALHGIDARERSAAERVIANFCASNPDGQITLASTIAPVADAGEMPATFGGELAAALVMGPTGPAGLLTSSRAASVLQHLLIGNPTAKQRLLLIPIELPPSPSAPPELLLPRCLKYLSEALRTGGPAGKGAAALLLRLLTVWLSECPPAIGSLLAGASHLPLLVDLVTGRLGSGDMMISGLAAVLLGVCVLHAPQDTSGGSAYGGAADTVLDVVLSRVGLSGFFSRLDELRRLPAFVAASAVPKLPKPITRAAAAAAVAGEGSAGEEEGEEHEATSPPLGAAATASAVDKEKDAAASVFDFAFTQFVGQVEEAVKAKAMDAFARPGGGAQGSGGGAGSSRADVAAGLPGASDQEKLGAALDAILKLQDEVSALRARNHALAEDLFRVAQGGTAAGSAGAAGNSAGAGGAMGSAALATSSAALAADVEARVAAEMRASRAEMEAATLRQQVEALSARLSAAEHDAVGAREAASSAYTAASKHEADLQDLSGAYNTLEAHSFALEAQVRELQAKLAAAGGANATSAPAPGMVSEAELARRVEDAVAAVRMEAAAAVAAARTEAAAAAEAAQRASQVAAAAAGGLPEAEVVRRVEAAVAEAKEQADKDTDDQLTDLLVCLGQEEQKVAVLREKLAGYGVDVDSLLAKFERVEEEEEELQ